MSETRWTTQSNPESGDIAILLPGSGYTTQGPLLYWCAELLAERGWQVRAATWGDGGGASRTPVEFVEESVEAGFGADGLGEHGTEPNTGKRLIVAKSFGSLAAPWASRHGVPGIWVTPLVTDDPVAESLRDATANDFAVGGDADELWRPDRLTGTRARIMTVAAGDHALRVPGGWRASLEAHRAVFEAIELHLS